MKLRVLKIRECNDKVNTDATLENPATGDRFSLSSKTLRKAGAKSFNWTEDHIFDGTPEKELEIDLSLYEVVASEEADGRVYKRIVNKGDFREQVTRENIAEVAKRNGLAGGHYVVRKQATAVAPAPAAKAEEARVPFKIG